MIKLRGRNKRKRKARESRWLIKKGSEATKYGNGWIKGGELEYLHFLTDAYCWVSDEVKEMRIQYGPRVNLLPALNMETGGRGHYVNAYYIVALEF